VDEGYMVGYGLGAPDQGRNLGYVATTARNKASAV
jgi:hypoxanthine-guanine phosphoribosyltransferase